MQIECRFNAVQYRCGCTASYSSMLHITSVMHRNSINPKSSLIHIVRNTNTVCGKMCWHHNIQDMKAEAGKFAISTSLWKM